MATEPDPNGPLRGANKVRNVCILAHVDHGKTTIADLLVASNGHISRRTAGNVRFLDDRKDEQERGITMKTSAISLTHDLGDAKYIINLVDTPGHIDFSTEVAAAVRICDGALIVVDVIEGVCVQTKEAIKQAFSERVKMILLINKLDRIIVEQLKPMNEVFLTIMRIIEDCNSYLAQLFIYDIECTISEEEYLFAPEKCNVLFGSAIDGWAINTMQIAMLFSPRLPQYSISELNGMITNPTYYASGTTIKSGAVEKGKPNLFITMFLNSVYYVYYCLRIRCDRDQIPNILTKLMIPTDTPEVFHSDLKVALKAIFNTWCGMATVLFHQFIKRIPAPTRHCKDRYDVLINVKQYFGNKYLTDYAEQMVDALIECDKTNDFTYVYVSKMFPINKAALQQRRTVMPDDKRNKVDAATAETPLDPSLKFEQLSLNTSLLEIVGLARIFSGSIFVNQKLYILGPKYVPPKKDENLADYIEANDQITEFTVKSLHILLGRDFVSTESVQAGNIFGIMGLENKMGRMGTLSSTPYALPFNERVSFEPVIRNAIQCKRLTDMPLLREGLKFLKKIDSCVQVTVEPTGEFVLMTAGDVHLAKCIEDITTTVPNIQLNVSKPMVSLRETVQLNNPRKALFNSNSIRLMDFSMNDIGLELRFYILPLPDNIFKCIQNNFEVLTLVEEYVPTNPEDPLTPMKKVYTSDSFMAKLTEQLNSAFQLPHEWAKMWANLWSISKNRDSLNILLNLTPSYKRNLFHTLDKNDKRHIFDQAITNAFNMACQAGPICDEPLSHCVFVVTDYKLDYSLSEQYLKDEPANAALPTLLREAFKDACVKHQPRLMEPMFLATIQVSSDVFGKVYKVINRHHGKITESIGMDDDERVYMVKAEIPVLESYGLANELRTESSGNADLSLRFSHYKVLDGDPYYKEEDAEDEDEDETIEAIARSRRAAAIRTEVRIRKGLQVEQQVIMHAEKQRTLNKKK